LTFVFVGKFRGDRRAEPSEKRFNFLDGNRVGFNATVSIRTETLERPSRGAPVFRVESGSSTGLLRVIDPNYKFPRRRSSVRTPEIKDLHEDFPVVDIDFTLPRGTLSGASAFWKHVYETVRTAAPFPIRLEESIEAVKFANLMKKASLFGK
jgi:hypothetical protein